MVKPKKDNVKKKMEWILQQFRLLYPNPKTALTFSNPLEILVATILSAQCTDVRVNKVTPALFKRFPTALDYAEADENELQEFIRSTGFFRSKAKNIQGACRMMVQDFQGNVPATMEELLLLPGVARKTANVVLQNAFGKLVGVVVDTHVQRLSRRIGFTQEVSPIKIEQDLMKIVPQKEWEHFSYWHIEHGRAVCKSQRPQCDKCVLAPHCNSAFSYDAKGKWRGP